MAPARNAGMLATPAMNTEDYVAILQARPPVAPARPVQGPFAALQRLINTASFVSVDLTDTVAATLQAEREREARRYINYLE